MPKMTHSLVKPNQLRHFGTFVQDIPSSLYLLHIWTADANFYMQIEIQGTNIYANTHITNHKELGYIPYIVLYLNNEWNPVFINFHRVFAH